MSVFTGTCVSVSTETHTQQTRCLSVGSLNAFQLFCSTGNRCSLSTYYVPGTTLVTEVEVVTGRSPCLSPSTHLPEWSPHQALGLLSSPQFPNTKNDAFWMVNSCEICVDVWINRKLREGRDVYGLEVGKGFCRDELS